MRHVPSGRPTGPPPAQTLLAGVGRAAALLTVTAADRGPRRTVRPRQPPQLNVNNGADDVGQH